MIVIDSSAGVERLLGSRAGAEVKTLLAREGTAVVPAHFDAEVYGTLRRLHLRGRFDRVTIDEAVRELIRFPATRIPLAPLLAGALRLVDRIGAHDAFFVVLAEDLGVPLLTCDARLARAVERDVRTILVPVA